MSGAPPKLSDPARRATYADLEAVSTRTHDRERKMKVYERAQVHWAWLLDPIEKTLEVFTLAGARWGEGRVYHGDAQVRAVPFDAVELDLALLWAR